MGPISLSLSLFSCSPSDLPLQLKGKQIRKKVSSLHCKSLLFATETDHKHSSSKLTNKKKRVRAACTHFLILPILTQMLDWSCLHSCEELRSYWFACAWRKNSSRVPVTGAEMGKKQKLFPNASDAKLIVFLHIFLKRWHERKQDDISRNMRTTYTLHRGPETMDSYDWVIANRENPLPPASRII